MLASGCTFVWFALMPRELQLQVFGGSAHTFQHFEWDSEFAIAHRADRNRWSSSEPLEHP
jgi:hypothetical protein